MTISCLTPVVFTSTGFWRSPIREKTLNRIEKYFIIQKTKGFLVLPPTNLHEPFKRVGSFKWFSSKSSLIVTVLKIISYITLVIPLILFVIRLVLREPYDFSLARQGPKEKKPLGKPRYRSESMSPPRYGRLPRPSKRISSGKPHVIHVDPDKKEKRPREKKKPEPSEGIFPKPTSMEFRTVPFPKPSLLPKKDLVAGVEPSELYETGQPSKLIPKFREDPFPQRRPIKDLKPKREDSAEFYEESPLPPSPLPREEPLKPSPEDLFPREESTSPKIEEPEVAVPVPKTKKKTGTLKKLFKGGRLPKSLKKKASKKSKAPSAVSGKDVEPIKKTKESSFQIPIITHSMDPTSLNASEVSAALFNVSDFVSRGAQGSGFKYVQNPEQGWKQFILEAYPNLIFSVKGWTTPEPLENRSTSSLAWTRECVAERVRVKRNTVTSLNLQLYPHLYLHPPKLFRVEVEDKIVVYAAEAKKELCSVSLSEEVWKMHEEELLPAIVELVQLNSATGFNLLDPGHFRPCLVDNEWCLAPSFDSVDVSNMTKNSSASVEAMIGRLVNKNSMEAVIDVVPPPWKGILQERMARRLQELGKE